jgi:hypothetical protein
MRPTEEQMSIINSRLPGTKMTSDQVEVLPFRVFDNNVTDRFTVMSVEMMAKVAQDLNEGRAAFNKLHQSRETLPVGRSVNARLVENNMLRKEVHANMYAVIQNMDGSCAEDGKELADKYNTGSVYACSAGVSVGYYKCNICGNDIRDWQTCEHSPGKFYTVNEQPKQCIALMTGRNIQDGIAMDCGIYEVSAVTAGGVASAGVLTETFGQYSEGTDIVEFKKTAFADNKEVNARITFEALHVESTPELPKERKTTMALEEKDVQKMIDTQFGAIVADKAKLEVEFKHLEEKFQNATAETAAIKTELATARSEFSASTDAFVAEKATLVAEKAALVVEKTTVETTFASEKEVLAVEKTVLEAFKTAYINSVFEAGNKIGKTDALEVYASKPLEELQTLATEFAAELNKLPSGRQTVDEQAGVEYNGIPESVYKTDK